MIHVYPLNDEKEHDTGSTSCWCVPRIEWEHAEAIVIHNAADCRELVEQAERLAASPPVLADKEILQ